MNTQHKLNQWLRFSNLFKFIHFHQAVLLVYSFNNAQLFLRSLWDFAQQFKLSNQEFAYFSGHFVPRNNIKNYTMSLLWIHKNPRLQFIKVHTKIWLRSNCRVWPRPRYQTKRQSEILNNPRTNARLSGGNIKNVLEQTRRSNRDSEPRIEQ